MSDFKIQGGAPIGGTLIPEGAKNAVLPELSAALLTSEKVKLIDSPSISDVRVIAQILNKLGVEVNFSDYGNDIEIDSSKLSGFELDKELSSKIRASNLLISSILVRQGRIKAYMPGGDKSIGLRDMSAHFDAFIQSGYKIINNEDLSFSIEKDESFKQNDFKIFLYEPSVTATENAIILNVIGEGTTEIYNAACEPHVRDLCDMLNKMGAKIEGVGTNRISIIKVSSLHGVEHKVVKDPIYIGTFIIFSLLTKGELLIKDIIKEDMLPILTAFRRFNVKWEWRGTDLFIPAIQSLEINTEVYSNVGIYSQPWPMFPSDLLPLLVPLASIVKGETIIFEKMYSNRLVHTLELNKLGSNISLLDDYRVLVKGGNSFLSGNLTCVDDLRSVVLYLSVMLSSSGESILRNIDYVYRGYPKIEEVLNSLGAKIEKL